jgi:hypothetical protein
MRSSTKYVGLDVHQATTSATVRESSGKIIVRSVLPTEEDRASPGRTQGVRHGFSMSGRAPPEGSPAAAALLA